MLLVSQMEKVEGVYVFYRLVGDRTNNAFIGYTIPVATNQE